MAKNEANSAGVLMWSFRGSWNRVGALNASCAPSDFLLNCSDPALRLCETAELSRESLREVGPV